MPVPEPTTADPHAWAKAYAKRGWRVLPIKPGEKRPPMAAWQEAATTDEATIDNWWTQLYRGHGIGVATGRRSGIFVLDVDVSDGKAGNETLADLEGQHGQLPATPVVITPSAGCHYYFKVPAGQEIRNDASKRLGPGLDIRGEGGQVVAPPTIRGGFGYEWMDDTYQLEPAEAPGWLLALLSDPVTPERKKVSDPVGVASMPRLDQPDSPAERFNAGTTWPELLEADGWLLVREGDNGYSEWTRPGKDPKDGGSATVGYEGRDILKVFTTSLDWLPEGAYSRFQYLAKSKHGGDESAAAKAIIRSEGGARDDYLEAVMGAQGAAQAPSEAPEGMETGWEETDVQQVLSSDYDPPKPELLRRLDGAALFYRGRVNAIYGESGSGKSWMAMKACAQEIQDGKSVLYIDYEDHPGSVLNRMLALGVGLEDLIKRFHYISPQVAWSGQAALYVRELVDRCGVTAVVIDSTGEAMAMDGADPNSDDDTARWFRQVPRFIADLGPAVILLDHIPKANDAPKRFAIGSQRKLAAIDGAAYRVTASVAPAKGTKGFLKVMAAKDRNGAYQHGHKVADIEIVDTEHGTLVIVKAPDSDQPTHIMGQISKYLEAVRDTAEANGTEPVWPSPSAIEKVKDAIVGKATSRRWAIECLVEGGYVAQELRPGHGGGKLLRLIRPFEEVVDNVMNEAKTANSVPTSNPVSEGDGVVAQPNSVPPSRPTYRGREGTGLGASERPLGNSNSVSVSEEVNLPSHIEDRDLI